MRSKNLVSVIALMTALTVSGVAEAKGGVSSGGGGHASSSGSHASSSSSSASRGGFSSSPSSPSYRPAPSAPSPTVQSAPRPSAPVAQSAPAQRTVTTTTTQTTQRSVNTGSRYITASPMYYGGWGVGYGYNNGLLTGIIIGNMMHPHNTTVYNGPGYGGNAVLYPNGAVVNPQGYQVGTYQNGQFAPMQNGPMVAQQAPADAFADSNQQFSQSSQPTVVVQPAKPSWTFGEVFSVVFLLMLISVMVWFLFFRNTRKGN